jgi:DNA polymerase-1
MTACTSPFAGADRIPVLADLLADGACEVTLDFETTGATPWVQGGFSGNIGGELTPAQYCKKHDCTVDSRLRARILSIGVPTGGFRAAFDLDLMDEGEQRQLIGMLSGHYWVGHNLQFDYAWALSICPDVRPAKIIDTMLMVTCFRPELPYEMQQAVTNPSRVQRDALRTYAAGKGQGDGMVSLQALSLLFFDEDMDKCYQKPVNWTPEYLTPEHYEYCLGDIDAPGYLARALLGLPYDASTADMLAKMQQAAGYTAYNTMTAAIPALVRMQHKGFYWDTARAAGLDAELGQQAQQAVTGLLLLAPDLGDFAEVLTAPSMGMTKALKEALAKVLQKETGRWLPKTERGGDSVSAGVLQQAFPNSNILKAYLSVADATSERKKIQDYQKVVSEDGRLHPATSILTVTGRTASRNPNLQNIPRDSRFRAIFAAPTGYQLIATDFSSVELRIAAALGVRALRLLHQIIAARRGDADLRCSMRTLSTNLDWIFSAVPELWAWLQAPLQPIPTCISTAETDLGQDASFRARALVACGGLCGPVQAIWAATGGNPERLAMRLTFANGLDPHIMTALAMESAAGRFDLQGKLPVDYLQALSPDDRKALKTTLKGPRQAAKGVNFGLLYGMSAGGLHQYGTASYGLDWTLDDAEMARQVFFSLYPELALWHWLTKQAMKQKRTILNPYNGSWQAAENGGKVYWGSTLSDRPTVAAKITAASNYQDQGTGAEIALSAINALPDDVGAMIVNFVHDEIILEVPDFRVAEVQAILEKTMVQAADAFLMPFGVPTEVESAIGGCWQH